MPRPRRTTAERGYGSQHAQARRRWLDLLAQYGSLPCTRCSRPVRYGEEVHLDHNDTRTGYLGLAHASCNCAAGAVKRNTAARVRSRRPSRTSRDWW